MEDLHDTWSHRWVNPKAKEKSSQIDRNGLIAIDAIPAGEAVIVYGGVIVPKADIEKYRSTFGDYDVPIDEDFSIAPTSHDEITATGSVNHSCEPTIGWKNAITLATIRDVEAGEELTVDYAFHGGYPENMECKCGTKSCRKIIKPTDWQDPEIQARFAQWYQPWVKAKIN